MVIRVETLISFFLGLCLFAGFQGGLYYFANRLQEVGILIIIILFVYGAIRASFVVRDLNWDWWVFVPILFLLYTMLLPSWIFSVHNDVIMLPSILNARIYLLTLLCPAIYLLYRNGYPLEKIERVFFLVMVILLVHYIFKAYTLDLVTISKSPILWYGALVNYDPVRGYRLDAPVMAIFVLTAISAVSIFQKRSTKETWIGWICFAICIWNWMLLQSRGAQAAFMISMILFTILFCRPSRKVLVMSFCIVVPCSLFLLSNVIVETFGAQSGAELRFHSYAIAWETALKYPFTGMGQASYYSMTYQQVENNIHFYTSDIGIMGVAYRYGFLGALIYLAFTFFMIQRMVKLIWMYKHVYGRHNRIMVSLLIFMLTLTVNIMLTTHMTFGHGSAAGAFLIGYSSCWMHKFKTEHPALFVKDQRRSYRPSVPMWAPG